MSIVERLFPASELEALRVSSRASREGQPRTEQRRDIDFQSRTSIATCSASSHGFHPRQIQSPRSVRLLPPKIKTPHSRRRGVPNFVLLNHVARKDRFMNVVYALDRAGTDASQDYLAHGYKVDRNAVSPSVSSSPTLSCSKEGVAAQPHTIMESSWRESGIEAGMSTDSEAAAVDQETAQGLLDMPLMTMHERDLLNSLLPKSTPWANDELNARHLPEENFSLQVNGGVRKECTRVAGPDLFDQMNLEKACKRGDGQARAQSVPMSGSSDESTSLSGMINDEDEELWIVYPWHAAA